MTDDLLIINCNLNYIMHAIKVSISDTNGKPRGSINHSDLLMQLWQLKLENGVVVTYPTFPNVKSEVIPFKRMVRNYQIIPFTDN